MNFFFNFLYDVGCFCFHPELGFTTSSPNPFLAEITNLIWDLIFFKIKM